MAQPANAANRQQLNLINSPVFKAVSCIPYVGMVSSVFPDRIMLKNFNKAVKAKDADGQIEALKISKEYRKIDMARNLLSVVLVVGAIALGILSGPIGAILVSAHFAFTIFAIYHAYAVGKMDQDLKRA